MVVGGKRHAPAALSPGKNRYLFYRWLGGPQVRSGQVWKNLSLPGLDPRTVQPVASRCTDWDIPTHNFRICKFHKIFSEEIKSFMRLNFKAMCHVWLSTWHGSDTTCVKSAWWADTWLYEHMTRSSSKKCLICGYIIPRNSDYMM